ncbi:UNVERIFIED_CONTAM: putative ribosomal large subunit pseudouridine synthase SVR1, chloroplastic [Sesamum angustifolium]|uniref:Ribosomal large subunit pseudouridine synthase SVR1, chloroplastic n=1 Tax=Sesamum angustifolium TaxID=2727405 RepID=A0AAW2PTU1_9LAMI
MATIAAAATAFITLHLSRTSFILPSRRLRTFVTSSFSTTTTTITAEFNIKFAPPKPKPQLPNPSAPDLDPPDSSTSELGDQLFIPWIVRDENGNLTLRATPPERFLKAMAHQNTQKKKKKDVKSAANKVKQPAPSAEPKYSKAARRFYNERFREPPQRLAKVLAAAGVASRRSSEELIFQGKVTVNGSVCNTPQTRVDPDRDVIYVNGNRLPKKLPPKVYLALNKPKGYICSAGEKETKSVMSLFDDFMKSWSKRNPGLPRPRLFTVGRLDVATTGLIIVTNDGEFANKVSHPSSNLSKEYIATINGAVHKRHLFAISEGTVIEGVHCTPDSVELLPQQPDISRPRLRIVVHEGRNHEVRELVKNAGLQIHALKRVRIGGFRLPTDLALGKHVELSSANLRALGWKS